MTPSLSSNQLTDASLRDPELLGEGKRLVGRVVSSDPENVGVAELAIAESWFRLKNSVLVKHVLGCGGPFKVLKSVVVLDAVLVIALGPIFGCWTNECFKNDPVNFYGFSTRIVDESVYGVPLRVDNFSEDSSLKTGDSLEPSEVGDFVVSFPTNDRTPFFGYDQASHARSPETGVIRAERRYSVVRPDYCNPKRRV